MRWLPNPAPTACGVGWSTCIIRVYYVEASFCTFICIYSHSVNIAQAGLLAVSPFKAELIIKPTTNTLFPEEKAEKGETYGLENKK